MNFQHVFNRSFNVNRLIQAETYLEPCQTSTIAPFCDNSKQLQTVSLFLQNNPP